MSRPLPVIREADFRAGGDADRWPIEELRERYSVIPSLLGKIFGDLSQEALDDVTRAFALARERMKGWNFGPGEIEGWRRVIYEGHGPGSGYGAVMAVRDDGLVFQGVSHDWRGEGHGTPREGAEMFLGMLSDRRFARVWETDSPIDFWRGTMRNRIKAQNRAKNMSNLLYKILEDKTGDKDGLRQMYAVVTSTVKRIESKGIAWRARSLFEALDGDVQKIMRSTATYDMHMANMLAGEVKTEEGASGPARLRRACPEIAARRKQAVEIYPVLAGHVLKEWRKQGRLFRSMEPNAGLVERIDAGEPLLPVFAEEYDLNRAHLRRLQGVTWQRAGREAYREPETFLGGIAATDPNHIPRSRRGFAEMRACFDAAREVSRLVKAREAELMTSVGGNFGKIASLLEGNPATGVRDMHEYLVDSLVVPAAAQAFLKGCGDRSEAAKRANALIKRGDCRTIEGMGLRHALQASAKWHRALPRLLSEIGEGDTQVRWKPIAGEVDLGAGLKAMELSSDMDLRREGTLQNHCVGGYADHVMDGHGVIFSIRRADEILSTVEIGLERGEEGRKLRIAQNYARGNTTPCPEAEKAARSLCAGLRKLPEDRWRQYGEGLSERQHERRKGMGLEERLSRSAGYDIFDQEKLEKAWQELSPFLPRNCRKQGLKKFGESYLDLAQKKEDTSFLVDEIPF